MNHNNLWMDKVVNPGHLKRTKYGPEMQVFCEIQIDNSGFLSISGVEGPRRNGDAYGSCGQIDMGYAHRNPAHNDDRYDHLKTAGRDFIINEAGGWTVDLWLDFLDVWHNWHNNDMRAGCHHQRRDWDMRKKLEVMRLAPGDTYWKQEGLAKAGQLAADDYFLYGRMKQAADSLWLGIGRPGHPTLWGDLGALLISEGWLKVDKTEVKGAGWTYPVEHPDGLLTKPCPECGYKYGSAWLKEPLPQDVVDFLVNLPWTSVKPAWV